MKHDKWAHHGVVTISEALNAQLKIGQLYHDCHSPERQEMIPPINFIHDLLIFLHLCSEYLEYLKTIDDNMEIIKMSFMSLMEIMMIISHLCQLCIDYILESNREWDANRILEYLFGYRCISSFLVQSVTAMSDAHIFKCTIL